MTRMNKKALSEIVGYVLLIVLAISLSIGVYAWLKGYIWKPQEKCPDGTSLIIENYNCSNGIISLKLRNQGSFNIDGFIIKVGNKTGSKPIYPLSIFGQKEKGYVFFDKSLKPAENKEFSADYSNFGKLREMMIEPIRTQEGKIILCENAVISQEITNC